jgi:alpha-2-macroglobulin-like protein
MEKKTLLKSLAILLFVTLLLSAFTERCAETHPFVEKLKTILLQFGQQQAAEKVYLQLDRNFYQPNDLIWFSAWIRDADHLRADSVSGKLYVELIDPKGTIVQKQNLNAVAGLTNGNFQLKDAVGGIYKIKAYTNWQKNSDAFFEREIQVQKVVLPNLKMTLDFEKKAYGPGDEVVAQLEAKDLEDHGLRLHEFTYHVSLGGKVAFTEKATFDFDGKLDLRFSLPDTLHTRDGLLQTKTRNQIVQ